MLVIKTEIKKAQLKYDLEGTKEFMKCLILTPTLNENYYCYHSYYR